MAEAPCFTTVTVRAARLDSLHGHTHMLCLHHDRVTPRGASPSINASAICPSGLFLNLKAFENTHSPGQLAQSRHLLIRYIGDMHFSVKRKKMMFTDRIKCYVLSHNQVIIFPPECLSRYIPGCSSMPLYSSHTSWLHAQAYQSTSSLDGSSPILQQKSSDSLLHFISCLSSPFLLSVSFIICPRYREPVQVRWLPCSPASFSAPCPWLYSAKARPLSEGGGFGIFAENVRYEYDKILEYKEGTSGSLRQGVEQLLRQTT